MTLSNITTFYPDNKALVKAIDQYKSLVSAEDAVSIYADNTVTVADNFLYTRGNYEQHRYNSNVLTNAREMFELKLAEETNELEKAAIQNSYGNILAAIAQKQRDVELFNKAIECFNSSLQIFSQEESPLEWAETQANLGTALQALGRQESDAKLMNNAIDAYTESLLEYTRKETPEEWSMVMFQLAATFHSYGSLLKGNRTFQKSVVAYKNALAELDADLYALELAATHNNRGAVLHHLGESEENADRIEEAIRAYETALTVSMEQQLPFHLAVLIRINKATAHAVFAELTKNAALMEETADEFELIIACFPHAIQPLCLKHCEAQLIKARA